MIGMNFGLKYRRKVRETMSNAKSVVEQEGVSESFRIEQEVR